MVRFVKGCAVEKSRVFPLKHLGSKVPAPTVIDLIARDGGHQQEAHGQRQAEQAGAAQGADHKQEGVAGQKWHDHQTCLDKHNQEQQDVDPGTVIPNEGFQIAVDVKYKVQQLHQGVHGPIIPVFCPFKIGAKPGAGTPTI